jgi:hypothetical protein
MLSELPSVTPKPQLTDESSRACVCEGQSWLTVRAVALFHKDIFACPLGYANPRLKITVIENRVINGCLLSFCDGEARKDDFLL